jgi:hypothetical protein
MGEGMNEKRLATTIACGTLGPLFEFSADRDFALRYSIDVTDVLKARSLSRVTLQARGKT